MLDEIGKGWVIPKQYWLYGNKRLLRLIDLPLLKQMLRPYRA